MKIAIIGTGYVGLVTGVCLAEIGHFVTLIDKNSKKIVMLSSGIPTIHENGLQEMMVKNSAKLKFTTDLSEAMIDSEVVFIAVGTPDNGNGKTDLSQVLSCAKEISQNLSNTKANPIIVTKSTVPVGTNAKIKEFMPNGVEVISNPEFLREGMAIQDFMQPDRIVIGGENENAMNKIVEIYQNLSANIIKTDIKSAELAKYASNAFLATKIAFINEIATLSGKIGANVLDIAKIMGEDKRIGKLFLKPGPGYGGSCFPKDTKSLNQQFLENGVESKVTDATIKSNFARQNFIVDKILEFNVQKICFLGIAFKAGTDDIRESPAIYIIQKILEKSDAKISVYDPIAKIPEELYGQNSNRIKQYQTAKEAIENANLVVISTEWEEFRNLKFTDKATPILDLRFIMKNSAKNL